MMKEYDFNYYHYEILDRLKMRETVQLQHLLEDIRQNEYGRISGKELRKYVDDLLKQKIISGIQGQYDIFLFKIVNVQRYC